MAVLVLLVLLLLFGCEYIMATKSLGQTRGQGLSVECQNPAVVIVCGELRRSLGLATSREALKPASHGW